MNQLYESIIKMSRTELVNTGILSVLTLVNLILFNVISLLILLTIVASIYYKKYINILLLGLLVITFFMYGLGITLLINGVAIGYILYRNLINEKQNIFK